MFKKSTWEFFAPDNKPFKAAMKRTSHMAVAAHQDDVEIMACDGILQCFGQGDKWFTAMIMTDGAGSSRRGLYQNFSDTEMKKVRRNEQKKAAFLGEYGALVLLDYESGQVKDKTNKDPVEDLKTAILLAKPKVIYTHNIMDKHTTHVAVALRLITGLRELPKDQRPDKLYGCEVWRGLDWIDDKDKVCFDLSKRQNISSALIGLFDSQISGGKRYDLATLGRWATNATYSKSHHTDEASYMSYGIDMTPLIVDDTLSVKEFAMEYVQRLEEDIVSKIESLYP